MDCCDVNCSHAFFTGDGHVRRRRRRRRRRRDFPAPRLNRRRRRQRANDDEQRVVEAHEDCLSRAFTSFFSRSCRCFVDSTTDRRRITHGATDVLVVRRCCRRQHRRRHRFYESRRLACYPRFNYPTGASRILSLFNCIRQLVSLTPCLQEIKYIYHQTLNEFFVTYFYLRI